MPVTLPNGVTIMNVTPHDLIFQDDNWDDVVVAPSEFVISADTYDRVVKFHGEAKIVHLEFRARKENVRWIEDMKRRYPNILLVGSVVAAQAYPEDIVAPVPRFRGERGGKRVARPLMNPNRFSVHPKGEINHGRFQTR